jgi:hypothetical protein
MNARSNSAEERDSKHVAASKSKLRCTMSPTCLDAQQRGDECIDLFARVVQRQ